MPRTIYALLVGIDDYPNPIPALHGCVNDIEAFAFYLSDRVDQESGVELRLQTLKNSEATREAVIAAFRQHLCTAGVGDVALFYYSGHGSQERAPEEFWKIEPDHLDETLVCYDSREKGKWDLADKELAKLIADVAKSGAHVTVVLDCCHSGSGTRQVTFEETAVRRAPVDMRQRPLESFIVSVSEAMSYAARGASQSSAMRSGLSTGRHVLLAACRDDQEAKECYAGGAPRGAFSYYLGDALRSSARAPTYRDLFARTAALVASQTQNQSPQLEATNPSDLDAAFLDDTMRPAPIAFTASFHAGGWQINGGQAHGLPRVAGDDLVQLALYLFDAPAEHLADSAKARAAAKVTAVETVTSRIEVTEGGPLDPKETYKAVIVALPTPALEVRLEGDQTACGLARAAIAKAAPGQKLSLFVCESPPSAKPEFRLMAQDGHYMITRPESDRPLVGQIEGFTEHGAQLAVRRLEHIARWTQTARLANRAATIRPGDIRLNVQVNGKDVVDEEIRLEYQLDKDGNWIAPTFTASLTNMSQRTLFCALLDLTDAFKIDASLLPAGCVKLEPGETAWALEGEKIAATVPDALWQGGIVEFRDILKLIVCTRSFDARLLEQDALDLPVKVSRTRSLPRNSTLNRLLNRIQTRDLSAGRPAEIDDWQTSQIAFTTVRPLPTVPIPATGQAVTLRDGVQIHGHMAFRANARLDTAPSATRALGHITLPHLLIDDPTLSCPLSLTTSRGSEAPLNVLELSDVVRPDAVTRDSPLLLTIPVMLADNEHVLPLAWDGHFFLPLGRVEKRSKGQTMIALERLPAPVVDRRSLSGAIKIFFQKIISRVIGLDFPYPLLTVADVDPNGAVQVTSDHVQVRRRVAQAQRIALFVHGIFGDTQSIVPSVQATRLADGRALTSAYDLVLAFDYENLNTTIEENGRSLKRCLEEVGLMAGHGKSLDIIAHSMGGLVSRWFIEREGGNQVARRLVMVGTPNGGSPWPVIADWAMLALAFGLNQFTAITWHATVVGGLSALMEDPRVALHQMSPHSEFLKTLAASDDPKIPYVLLAGNTSLIKRALLAKDSDEANQVQRLLARLVSPNVFHQVAQPFFFQQPNDIAVSVESMERIADSREPALDVRLVACDHLSYFRDPAGLVALGEVLKQ